MRVRSLWNGFGPNTSGAYPNGHDPNDLNLFGGFLDALKETIFGKKPSASCVAEAKTFQTEFIKNAPHLRAGGLFGGLATVSSLSGILGGAYIGYQTLTISN